MGDRIPKSIAWTFPEGASWISMCPPPPIPLIQGSSTETVKAVATAASTALPPSASTFAPAREASLCWEATIPLEDTTASFRVIRDSLKLWSIHQSFILVLPIPEPVSSNRSGFQRHGPVEEHQGRLWDVPRFEAPPVIHRK